MRIPSHSPVGKAWAQACEYIREQNSDKTTEELKFIIRVEYYKFLPNWKTYVYVKQ